MLPKINGPSLSLDYFGRQTLVYAVGLFALRGVSFLLIPLYTRTLTVTDYGLLLTLFVTAEILTIFMGGEIKSAFIRYYKDFDSQERVGNLWGTSVILSMIGCLIFSAFSAIFLPSLFEKANVLSKKISFVFATILLAVCITLYRQFISYYRAGNDAVKYTIFNISTATATLFLTVLILGLLDGGVQGALYARSISYGIVGLYMFVKISIQIRPSFSKVFVHQLVRFGLPLVLAASAWFILEASDRYFLARFKGLGVVGIYGLGYKVASILFLVVVLPFQLAYGPFVFYILDKSDVKQKVARLFFYLILCLFAGGLILGFSSPLLLRMFAPPEYGRARLVVLCIIPSAVMMGIYYWGSALIHIAKKTHLIALITTVAATLNLLLNYLLIPKFGWFGAALSTNASFCFATIGICFFGMRLFPVPLKAQGGLIFIKFVINLRCNIDKLFVKVSSLINN